jgi:hypothetical protein
MGLRARIEEREKLKSGIPKSGVSKLDELVISNQKTESSKWTSGTPTATCVQCRVGQIMIDPWSINGKRLAMIAWGEKPDGSSDVAVFSGLAQWDGLSLTMQRENGKASFLVPGEWISRIGPVVADIKEILPDADFYFSVTVGNLDVGKDHSAFIATGLKWPSDGKTG